MKKRSLWKKIIVGIAVLFIASPVFLTAEKITLKLNWVPGGDHCFYFVAKELGYYAQNGLNVKIERGQGSGDTVKRVELGTVDVGLADTGTLAVARSKGSKVKVIAMIYSSSPNGIKTWKGSGITSPKDLEGHSVGVPSGDAQRVLWPALARANGVNMKKVRLINIKPGAKAQALAAKRVDAVFDWIVGNIPYWKAGLDVNKLVLIPWANWGINPYGNALIASEKTIKQRPDMLRRFLNATMKAWRWSLENPDKALKIFSKNVPEVRASDGIVRFVDDVRQLLDINMIKKTKLGWTDKARMEKTVGYINKYFKVTKPITAEEMYTNAFLPNYSLPDLSNFPTISEAYHKWKQSQ